MSTTINNKRCSKVFNQTITLLNNIPYIIGGGTCLNLYRDKDLVDGEDIDMLVENTNENIKNIYEIFKEAKYVFKYSLSSRIYQIAYEIEDICIDIHFYISNKQFYCTRHTRGDLCFPKSLFDNRIEYNTKYGKVFMPYDIEQFLTIKYGNDWKTPQLLKKSLYNTQNPEWTDQWMNSKEVQFTPQEIDIKNSIKKIIIQNLAQIFGDSICFTGSLCDYFYADYPLGDVGDIDLLVPLSFKNQFINTMLNSNFIINSTDKKKHTVKVYNTHPTIRNFNIRKNYYVSRDREDYKYSFHMKIFGVSLDINFYADTEDCGMKYKKYLNRKNEIRYPFKLDMQKIKIENSEIWLQAKQSRIELLRDYCHRISKHAKKLEYYEKNPSTKKTMEEIKIYKLPANFDSKIYQSKNPDLKKIIHKDGLLDHYLSYGIYENRVIYEKE